MIWRTGTMDTIKNLNESSKQMVGFVLTLAASLLVVVVFLVFVIQLSMGYYFSFQVREKQIEIRKAKYNREIYAINHGTYHVHHRDRSYL